MKPQEEFERKLRRVAIELKDLAKRISMPKSEPLEKPIQKGWKRLYILSDEAKLRPDHLILEAILQEIGSVVYHWRRDFRRGRRSGARMIEIKQPLKPIYPWKWHRLKSKESWRPYFHLKLYPRNYYEYIFTQPGLFKLKVERYWLTHVWILDSSAISRQAELERWMEFHSGWSRYNRLKGRFSWSFRKNYSRAKARDDLHQQCVEYACEPVDDTSLLPSELASFTGLMNQAVIKNHLILNKFSSLAAVRQELLRNSSVEFGRKPNEQVRILPVRLAGPGLLSAFSAFSFFGAVRSELLRCSRPCRRFESGLRLAGVAQW